MYEFSQLKNNMMIISFWLFNTKTGTLPNKMLLLITVESIYLL